MKYNAYLIPGFAADERMYRNFKLHDCDITCLNWSFQEGVSSYAEYAKQILLPQINNDKPIILVGFSMGGMIAVELAKLINPKKLVLIATAKNKNELPKGKVSFMRLIKPYTFMNEKRVSTLAKRLSPVFNFADKEHKDLFLSMVNGLPKGTIEFGLKAFLTWDNIGLPSQDYIHIHGANDKLIPSKRIKNYIEVDGGHYLLKTRSSKQITEMVNDFIK